jgi:hypothetical protein
MKSGFKLLIILIGIFSFAIKTTAGDIEKNFKNPPESTKPWVYWYWISSHITKEGITKDLEAMHEAGIGEAFIANVNDAAVKPGNVPVLSEYWWECMEHAIREAGRIGIKIGMFNCPGWSMSGGPWVGADKTMRYLVSSEIQVKGSQSLKIQLETPKKEFQQVVVQAFQTPKNENHNVSKGLKTITSSPKLPNPEWMFDGKKDSYFSITSYPVTIEITLEKPEEVRSIRLIPAEVPMHAYYELQYLDRNNYWRSIFRDKIDRQIIEQMGGPMRFGDISESFEVVKSKQFRIIFTDGGPLLPWIKLSENKALGCISEIELSGKALVSHYNEKQLGKMSPTPFISWDTYMWPKSAEPETKDMNIDHTKVLNITDKVDVNGVLTWDVPEGDWTIVRTGMTPTGSKNHPVTPECEGYEIDKMNKAHTKYHFDNFVGEILRRMPAADRKALTHVVMDSYEQGPQNWTDDMTARFIAAYGYDPTPWLPVLTGRVVDSAEKSDRFLWDLRRLVATLISTEYVSGLREKANENGLRLWCENYGFGYPGESLMYGGASDDISGEFWNTAPDIGPAECRIASSCANIYGKKTTSAEAFTSHQNHSNMPRDLKSLGDWSFTQGINHFVFHLYIHQPYDTPPGVNAWFGTDFNRNSTWFIKAKPYYDYVRRSSALLQSGLHVADMLYFLGEDTPKQSAELKPAPPAGTDYDLINAEVLLRDAYVKEGKIVLKSGISYNVLVLPGQSTMRPEVLQKISQLVNDGAVVIGPKPTQSPSLANNAIADNQIKDIAAKLWGTIDGIKITENRFGKGRMFYGITLEDVFSRMNLKTDVVLPEQFNYIHRKDGDSDIYFITNQSQQIFKGEIGFNISGMQPELWDAVTGETRILPEFTERNGYTFIPLQFNETDAWFIVFRNKISQKNSGQNFVEKVPVQTIEGSWMVSFDKSMDAPAKVEFKTLSDWATNENKNIQYYGGTATYSKTFEFTGDVSKSYSINLGRVEKLAAIRINGESLGTVWCYPYRLNITAKLKKGKNTIEVDITNPWWNRIVGDLQDGVTKKHTWMTFPFEWAKVAPLQPAGLLGPVVIERN